ncbi:MAG: hypothetical protein APF80_00065 [Alphaproteobacteria bacterium BRH_c36]|nr:MAG: hypothetical protein APF80_00065 [Alphaproteobacteria bacterium BRH_c36]
MRSTNAILAATAALALAGCGPGGLSKADGGTAIGAVAGGIIGNQVGSGTGKVLATVAGAFVGGVVGHTIGKSLDEQDRRYAQEAELAALEDGRSGVSRSWRNPDSGRYGEVVPQRPYKRGSRDCRDYTHTVFIDGRPETMSGTACRNPDGTWANIA